MCSVIIVGVTVLLTPPTVAVSPEIPEAEPMPITVNPPGMLKTESQSSLSCSWGDLGDSSIQEVCKYNCENMQDKASLVSCKFVSNCVLVVIY